MMDKFLAYLCLMANSAKNIALYILRDPTYSTQYITGYISDMGFYHIRCQF